MVIQESEFEHPVRGGRIRIDVFEEGGGYLVTEARDGVRTVVATLGAFDSRDQALARAEGRAAQLLGQRYRKVSV